jgi:exonuclease III
VNQLTDGGVEHSEYSRSFNRHEEQHIAAPTSRAGALDGWWRAVAHVLNRSKDSSGGGDTGGISNEEWRGQLHMLCWNARVVSSNKLIQHDTVHELRQYDIISITETGAATPYILQQHFPTHVVYDMPCTTQGMKGSGIAVLVRTQLAQYTSVELMDPQVSCLWLRINKAATRLNEDLLVATCYVPPATSKQVAWGLPLWPRFCRLMQHCKQLSQSGHLLLCGDFNARVAAGRDDLSWRAPPSVHPEERCCQDTVVNQAGRHLVDVCYFQDLALLTGRAPGDRAAPATYVHTRGSSRPDHVVVSHRLFALISSHKVLPSRFGSDHHPLHTALALEDLKTPRSVWSFPWLQFRRGHYQ